MRGVRAIEREQVVGRASRLKTEDDRQRHG
jgi:hypothetical protein